MPVQFEEQEFSQSRLAQQDRQGAVTGLVLKLGLAKNASQANLVMLVIAVIAIALTVFLVWPSNATAPEATDVAASPEN